MISFHSFPNNCKPKPTFTSLPQDIPLFEGIISDLFPGVKLPNPDFSIFMEALKRNIANMKLQPVPWFIDKIIQVRIVPEASRMLTDVALHHFSISQTFFTQYILQIKYCIICIEINSWIY